MEGTTLFVRTFPDYPAAGNLQVPEGMVQPWEDQTAPVEVKRSTIFREMEFVDLNMFVISVLINVFNFSLF